MFAESKFHPRPSKLYSPSLISCRLSQSSNRWLKTIRITLNKFIWELSFVLPYNTWYEKYREQWPFLWHISQESENHVHLDFMTFASKLSAPFATGNSANSIILQIKLLFHQDTVMGSWSWWKYVTCVVNQHLNISCLSLQRHDIESVVHCNRHVKEVGCDDLFTLDVCPYDDGVSSRFLVAPTRG